MKLTKFNIKDIDILDEGDMNKFMSIFNIECYREDDEIHAPIIMVYNSNSEDIKNRWEEIINSCAYLFQANINEEFIRRNMVMFFLSIDEINLNIRNVIQKNTYCCRKIVLDNVPNIDSAIRSYYLFGENVSVKVSDDSKLIELIKSEHKDPPIAHLL